MCTWVGMYGCTENIEGIFLDLIFLEHRFKKGIGSK